jgi:dipeptidyl-peptidase-4
MHLTFKKMARALVWSIVLGSVANFSRQFQARAATNDPLLTVERIFGSREFDGETAPRIVWRENGPGYHALEKTEAKGDGKDLVWNDASTGRKDIIVPAHAFIPREGSSPLPVERFEFSNDGSKLLIFTASKRVWRQNTRGDFWVLDITSRELRKLGGQAAPSTLMFARFSPDGKRVAYVHENNLYIQNLRDFEITPITTGGTATQINGTFDWVYEEELDLRDGFRWSPDGRSIAYWQIDSSGVRGFQLLNNTAGFYPESTTIPYPKTGEQNSAGRIGVVPASGGETRWMDIPGDPREHYLARMNWASNSTELIIQQFNRPQNTNVVFLADALTGRVRPILSETDSAWVENENSIYWMDQGKSFIWLSERDGWRRAYRVSRDGDRVSPVTREGFDVIHIEAVDETEEWLYYLASPEDPARRYLHRARLDGGKSERLTPPDQPGTHAYNVSPDAKWAIHTYSSFRSPPITELISLPEHKVIRTLEDNKDLREKLAALQGTATEFFRIELESEVALDGWCVKPPQFDPEQKYPVLFHVYGEPAGQTVLDRWGGKRGLWHAMLAQQGYIIMSVDNRGTPAPRGRSWRKSIHEKIGIFNVADQAAAVRALLKERPYLDPARVGIWGWSGGGSSTLNALFQHPGLYQLGMSVAPVANQRYYDTIYQERYMGLPAQNVEGYRLGSPLTHARHLRGDLLIIHGTGDDNVHYQGTEALINELITYKKPFSMMAYPNRRHGISEGGSTTFHLHALLTQFLKDHLAAGPIPLSSGKKLPPSVVANESAATTPCPAVP